MANKSLFASLTSRLPQANAVNEAGGRAYKLEPKHAMGSKSPLPVRSVTRSTARLRRNSLKCYRCLTRLMITSTWRSCSVRS